MTIDCPICKGSGQAVKHNGVHPQRQQELETCRICHGSGKLKEQPTERMHIKKYWNVAPTDI
jgi:DnaJ-class molecular chaperone